MSKTKLLGCLLCISLGCGAGVDESTGPEESAAQPIRYDQQLADLLPMMPGNNWQFGGESHPGHTSTPWEIRVEESAELGVRFTGLTRTGSLWLSLDERKPNTILAWNADTDEWGPFLRLDRKSWEFRASNQPCDRYRVTRLDDQTVTTGVGEFKAKAFQFELVAPANARCKAAPFERLLLSRNTGPVVLTNVGGEVTLQHALIRDTVLHHAVMPTTLMLEQTEYANQANTIRCVTQPCPSNEVTARAKFALAVTNAEDHEHSCEFRTARQYNFELVNEAGEVVKAWADGRTFSPDPTMLSFEPSQTRMLEGDVELSDREGVQLEGTYTVRASMFGHEQHAYPVTGRIAVKVMR